MNNCIYTKQVQLNQNVSFFINKFVFKIIINIITFESLSHPYCTEVWTTILESGWNLWVWLVGVVSRRWVWLVGGIYGYGYNV